MTTVNSQRLAVTSKIGTNPVFRRIVICLPLTIFLLTCAQAQQSGKVPRIGIVSGTGNPNEPDSSIKIFRQALQELGYVEGKNILFEYRYTEGNRDRVPGIVAELAKLKVDILFTTQLIVARAAEQATKTVPIVMAVTPDPVAAGLVDSLARPGGNITGLTFLTRELCGKRLELLTEMVPRLSRVGILRLAALHGVLKMMRTPRDDVPVFIPRSANAKSRLTQGFPSCPKRACQRDYHN